MIKADEFLNPARQAGFDFWAGVPCSFLTPLINRVIDHDSLTWVSSANEGDAVAAASGAVLGGRRGVAIMQNSGLGNAVSPLTSLNWVFRIPILLIVTLRGDPESGDEPQHELMGQITTGLLEQMDVAWQWFPDQAAEVAPALVAAAAHMDRTGRPHALLMRKGSVAPHELVTSKPQRVPGLAQPVLHDYEGELLSRHEVLTEMIENSPEHQSVLIATTGYTGRELYAIADRPNQLYMVGSMGCASSLALGLSLARPDLRVLVADGDGAALMRMGNLATIGACAGANFTHVILDNGMHESTGGQATTSHVVNFAAVAAASGYVRAAELAERTQIAEFLRQATGPALAQVCTAPGCPDSLPRPAITPAQVRERLMRHIGTASIGS